MIRTVARARLSTTMLSLITACGLGACRSTESTEPEEPFESQGIVAGFVRDASGRGIANAEVCATAVATVFGTSVLVTRVGSTSASGAYLLPLNLSFRADVRARVTVAATPPAGSGLEPAYASGLTVLITTTPPPAETTYANVVVSEGPTREGVVCISGP